jgi:hypothetical protein
LTVDLLPESEEAAFKPNFYKRQELSIEHLAVSRPPPPPEYKPSPSRRDSYWRVSTEAEAERAAKAKAEWEEAERSTHAAQTDTTVAAVEAGGEGEASQGK